MLSFRERYPQQFLAILSIIEAYAAGTVSSMAATRTNKCERQPDYVWLFDIENDIGEKNNLAEEHADVVSELQEAYREWESTIKDPAWPPKPNHPTATIDGVEYRVNI